MKTIKTQFGDTASADFEEGTITFLMEGDFDVISGKFAILDKNVYDEMLSVLRTSKKYFSENDKPIYHHVMYDLISKVINMTES